MILFGKALMPGIRQSRKLVGVTGNFGEAVAKKSGLLDKVVDGATGAFSEASQELIQLGTSEGTKKTETTSLDRSYITEYSYGVAESLNLIAPRLFGGGNGEKLSNDSAVYDYMLKYGATYSLISVTFPISVRLLIYLYNEDEGK